MADGRPTVGGTSERYVLSPATSVHQGPDGTLVVRSGTEAKSIRGKSTALVACVVRELTRPRTVPDVAARTGTPTRLVERTVAMLVSLGAVSHAGDLERGRGRDPAANAALSVLPGTGHPPADAPAVIGWCGDRGLADRFRQVITASVDVETIAVRTADRVSGRTPSLVVALLRDRDHPSLRRLDQWSRDVGVPYLAGWFEDAECVLTHVVIPFRTACYECLCVREACAARGHGAEWDLVAEHPIATAPPFRLAATDSVLTGLAALRTVHFLSGTPDEHPVPTLLSCEFATVEIVRHPVVRVPLCEGCRYAS